VTFTKPDGTADIVTIDSFRADSTAWFEYVVDQVGTWKLKFELPGQFFPVGNYTMPAGTSQANYTDSYTRTMSTSQLPQPNKHSSSRKQWSPPGLHHRCLQTTGPDQYPRHRDWWQIGGNFPWRGPSGGPTWDELYPNTYGYYTANTGFFAGDNQRFTPWVQAPDSSHIVWKRKIQLSGLHGGDFATTA